MNNDPFNGPLLLRGEYARLSAEMGGGWDPIEDGRYEPLPWYLWPLAVAMLAVLCVHGAATWLWSKIRRK